MNTKMSATPSTADLTYQDEILQGVSRTFALTIPQLPAPLDLVIGNAYLLCRIADTIEDDKDMSPPQKRKFADQFIQVLGARLDAETFARELYPELSPSATEDERDLIKNTPTVMRITHSFNQRQRAALERCVTIMADGMTKYQQGNVANGLQDQEDMDRYCYVVAGVVGEMLTALFCDHSAEINKHHDELMELAVSFGQGLQMTNILKDIWDDQKRKICWLPRSVFRQYGVEVDNKAPLTNSAHFQKALGHLIGVARGHLARALRYTLLLPKEEVGIRRFCLWALGMAVLTLRKINHNRDFTCGEQVKISRHSVKATMLSTHLFTRHDRLLEWLFNTTAKTLPVAEPG